MTFTPDSQQAALEARVARESAEAFLARVGRATARGSLGTTPGGAALVRRGVVPVAEALVGAMDSAIHRGTRFGRSAVLVAELPPEVAALVALSVVVDECKAPDRAFSVVARAIGRALSEEAGARRAAQENPAWWTALYTHAQRTRSPETRARRVRRAARRILGDRPARWKPADEVVVGGTMLELIREATGFIGYDRIKPWGRKHANRVVRPAPDLIRWLDAANRPLPGARVRGFPFVAPPRPREGWGGTPYHSSAVRPWPLVKDPAGAGTGYREAGEVPEDVAGAVRRLEATQWEVNPWVLSVMDRLHRRGDPLPGLGGADLDYPAPPEEANELTVEYRDYTRELGRVRQENALRRSRRVRAGLLLREARGCVGRALHFPVRLDFRGRLYMVGGVLSPQEGDLSRSLLRFPVEPVEDPGEWALAGAHYFGLGRRSYTGRRQWAADREEEIRNVARDPLGTVDWWSQASDPWQFLAWCGEYGGWLNGGPRAGGVPSYVDATQSGLQILGLVAGSRELANGTNAIREGAVGSRPEDLYQRVADRLHRVLAERTGDETALEWCRWFERHHGGVVPRGLCKLPVMTQPMGVHPHSVTGQIADWCRENGGTDDLPPDPKKGREQSAVYAPCSYLRKAVDEAMRPYLAEARRVMVWLRKAADVCTKAGVPVRWRSPTGFGVVQRNTRYETHPVHWRVQGRTMQCRYNHDTAELDPRRQRSAMVANFVQSVDAAVAARAGAGFDGPLALVHDCLGTRSDRAKWLAARAREALAWACLESDPLENLRRDVTADLEAAGSSETLAPFDRAGAIRPEEVHRAIYAFN